VENLVLGAQFPPASVEQWQSLVAKVLARSGVEVADAAAAIAALTSRTADGLEIAPLYTDVTPAVAPATGAPGAAPFTRGRTAAGNRAGWDVRAHIADPDPKLAAEQLLEDLEGGASSVWLSVGPAGTAVADIPAVLSEVLLDVAGVSLDSGGEGAAAAEQFLGAAAARGFDGHVVSGCLGIDPVGTLARSGDSAAAQALRAELGKLAPRVATAWPNLRTAAVDGLAYNDAGAADAQELGLALAAGVATLRTLTEAGLDVATALGQLEFRLAATADQFTTIAKLRAARRTWARVAAVCGETGPAAGQFQHVVTAWPMTTRHDPWNNMLRTTLACFAACVGGADAITVRPFDAALGRSDTLARRIARNTPTLLVEEAHMTAVVDPAGGSWYVEALTEAMAQAAWDFFTEVESIGGIVAALDSGWVADRLAATREARLADLAAGEAAIVGVTKFPIADERLLDRHTLPEPVGGGLPRIRWEAELEKKS
jgi:methylmalonyl-CoA mutase